ncbi:DUF262 domain-containing protein [Kocuria sp. ChxB]|uniref:GmrSD restriction endonuclease domain-containing protein n=1 Tax=Kocuria sp. ChxB TaxID=3035474 RepID=UPI00279ECA0F|nr:DUF262 domain-containing protein [Kocuria sp. ChxB]
MVAAQETSLQRILEGEKQYMVPLYQRPYQWSKKQWSVLWDDVAQLAEDREDHPASTHFIGSLVLAPSPENVAGSITRHLVVDGQQRLTTLTILLAAIRDHILEVSPEDRRGANRIMNQFLVNEYADEPHRIKLAPTQADRAPYTNVIDGTPGADGEGTIGQAYRFFRAQILGQGIDVNAVEKAVTSGLSLVSISTSESDNVHRIFESLNNTGLKLSQGDLLRNHIFMRLPTLGEEVYRTTWKPLQDLLTREDMDALFWLDAVQRNAKVTVGDTYQEQKHRFDRFQTENQIAAEVARLLQLARLYRVIKHPEEEESAEVRHRLQRLSDWGSATAAPLLLHLLAGRAAGRFDDQALASALLVIESLLVRRVLIGRTSASLNRMFAQAVAEIPGTADVVNEVTNYFSSGQRHFASNKEVLQSIHTMPFYQQGRANQRKLVLLWIEETYGSREPVSPENLTIEHVLPQTLSSEWRRTLESSNPAADVDEVHQSLVHTLGNLTLSGYNSKLSNRPFAEKRVELGRSGLRMNQFIAERQTWGADDISTRADELASMVCKAWPAPSTTVPDGWPGDLWSRLDQMLAEIPAGRWTTYGDLARALGTAAQPIGNRLRDHPVPHPHRVLTADARPAANFRWSSDEQKEDPAELLRQEGVTFDAHGCADREQRLHPADLAALVADPDDESGLEAENTRID